MNLDEFPAPKEGFVITHLLVVADQDRSREFYQSLFEGEVVLERDPVVVKVANTWLMLNVGGGPTDDKPGVTLALTPPGEPALTLPGRVQRRLRSGAVLPRVVVPLLQRAAAGVPAGQRHPRRGRD
jgi:hypothetical protein